MLARRPGTPVLVVGTGRPVEERALRGKPFAYRVLAAPRLEREWSCANAVVPFRFGAALFRAGGLLGDCDAAVAVGTGGYGSAPVLAAAWLRGTPRMILEQNIIPGMTNRLLARLADVACLAFEPSRAWLPPRLRAVVTGNPIRPVTDAGDAAGARRRLGLAGDAFTVLVFGGSQGAARLVAAVRDALPALAPLGVQLIVQTGDAAALDVPASWAGRLVVRPFFDEIYDCYRAADVVVGRAGGGVAEVLAFGKPAILVPYPYAAHDHQRRNAVYLEQEGAALVVADEDLTGARLSAVLRDFAADRTRREAMARAARELGRPDAAARVAGEVLALAGLTT